MTEQQNEIDSELIIGRNAVLEAIKSGREINTLLVAKGERGGSIGRILTDCRERKIVIKEVDKRKLGIVSVKQRQYSADKRIVWRKLLQRRNKVGSLLS